MVRYENSPYLFSCDICRDIAMAASVVWESGLRQLLTPLSAYLEFRHIWNAVNPIQRRSGVPSNWLPEL
jgi:hypothetical protein